MLRSLGALHVARARRSTGRASGAMAAGSSRCPPTPGSGSGTGWSRPPTPVRAGPVHPLAGPAGARARAPRGSSTSADPAVAWLRDHVVLGARRSRRTATSRRRSPRRRGHGRRPAPGARARRAAAAAPPRRPDARVRAGRGDRGRRAARRPRRRRRGVDRSRPGPVAAPHVAASPDAPPIDLAAARRRCPVAVNPASLYSAARGRARAGLRPGLPRRRSLWPGEGTASAGSRGPPCSAPGAGRPTPPCWTPHSMSPPRPSGGSARRPGGRRRAGGDRPRRSGRPPRRRVLGLGGVAPGSDRDLIARVVLAGDDGAPLGVLDGVRLRALAVPRRRPRAR